MNCNYCYLYPLDRKMRKEMTVPVVEAVAASITKQTGEGPVDVVWHGGEPLTVRIDRFAELCEIFESLRGQERVQHYVQTNATLIDDEWCDLFKRYEFNVGVSVDGPEVCNINRVDWSGRETFERTMRGVKTLKRNGVSFSVICVVSRETIGSPDLLFDFFERLGAEHVGFNFEEDEGSNGSRDGVRLEDVRHFWRILFDWIGRGAHARYREAGQLIGYLANARSGNTSSRLSTRIDPIPTVSWDGNTVLLSPELLGTKSAKYNDFIVGNVLDESITSMLSRSGEISYVQEFLNGVHNCRKSCDFFAFCQGGQAGNRFFELGDFTATETNYCRRSKQQLVLALHDYVMEEL